MFFVEILYMKDVQYREWVNSTDEEKDSFLWKKT